MQLDKKFLFIILAALSVLVIACSLSNIEISKKVLTLTKRGQQLELVFLKSDIVNGDVQDIIMVTEDGLSYLGGMLDKYSL